MRDILKPNLPQHSVRLIAITEREPALKRALQALGLDVLTVGPSSELQSPVVAHPDLLLHHLGGKRLLLAQNIVCDKDKLGAYGFEWETAQGRLGADYPYDILLCTLQIGHHAFGRKSHTEAKLLQHLMETNVLFHEVGQGYARCSTCVITEQAIATADPTIQKAARAAGIDCLCIPPGEIQLAGYAYGFLGGCCGLLAPDTLAIYGNARKLTYYDALACFASNHGVQILSLCPELLPTDVGTLVPLLCE